MIVTFQYGSGNSVTRNLDYGTTLGTALRDPRIKAALGFGDNVQGVIGNVAQADNTPLKDNMLVTVQDKACNKAS